MSGARGRPLGRIRRRLVAMLEEMGFVDARISAAQGRERSDPREDIYRWEGHASRSSTLACAVSIYSWDTMTTCVANGIMASNSSSDSDGGPTTYAISARPTKKKASDARKAAGGKDVV